MAQQEFRTASEDPEFSFALLDRELDAFATFGAITEALMVRRKRLNRAAGNVSLTTVYGLSPMSVDRRVWGQKVVGLSLAKTEIAFTEASAEAEFWGEDYFATPSPRFVRTRLMVLDGMSSKAKPIGGEVYQRPAVTMNYCDSGQLAPVAVDAEFMAGDPLEAAIGQDSYLFWLSRLATQKLGLEC